MFDFAWSEFLLIGVIALLVIGPKDLPIAIRAVTRSLKKLRGMASEFQTHVDEFVRESDLSDVRDSMRDLRSMNLRGQIMRTLDNDGTIRKNLSSPVLPPAITMQSADRKVDAFSEAHPLIEADDAFSQMHMPSTALTDGSLSSVTEPAGISDEAPSIIPPLQARRIKNEHQHLTPPAFLPPAKVFHAGRAVRPWKNN